MIINSRILGKPRGVSGHPDLFGAEGRLLPDVELCRPVI